jgi:photosystem II stability/assembly factor-like uncharacterized protein
MDHQLSVFAVLLCVGVSTADWVSIEPRVTDLRIADLCFADAAHGWAVGNSGLIMRTRDGGDNWVAEQDSSHTALNAVSFCDSLNGIAGGYEGLLMRTVDGGATWTKYLRRTSAPVQRVFLIDSAHVWAFAKGSSLDPGSLSQGVVLHSADAGATWQSSTVPEYEQSLEDFCACDSTCGYLIEKNGKVFKTVDGGLQWQELGPLPEPGADLGVFGDWLYDVQCPGRNQIWIRRAAREIVRSLDGGTTWGVVRIKLKGESTSRSMGMVHFADAAHGWALSVNPSPRVYSTSDSGRTWDCDSTLRHVPEALTVFIRDSSDHLWVAGRYGALYRSEKLNSVSPYTPQADAVVPTRFRRMSYRKTTSYTLSGRRCMFRPQNRSGGIAVGYCVLSNGTQSVGTVTKAGKAWSYDPIEQSEERRR